MSGDIPSSSALPNHENIQDALFALRDSLMDLKMTLLELAASTDPDSQALAEKATGELLARLRAS